MIITRLTYRRMSGRRELEIVGVVENGGKKYAVLQNHIQKRTDHIEISEKEKGAILWSLEQDKEPEDLAFRPKQ